MEILDEKLQQYLDNHLDPETPELQKINRETLFKGAETAHAIGPLSGAGAEHAE
jgi:hypothetical protein